MLPGQNSRVNNWHIMTHFEGHWTSGAHVSILFFLKDWTFTGWSSSVSGRVLTILHEINSTVSIIACILISKTAIWETIFGLFNLKEDIEPFKFSLHHDRSWSKTELEWLDIFLQVE